MNIKKYFWILPFLFFLGGYTVSHFIFHAPSIPAPHLVGKNLNQACTIASENNLNIRIIEHKNNTDLPEGTVLVQIPTAGQLVKPRQTIFLSLSQQPPKQLVPDLAHTTKSNLDILIKEQSIKIKYYDVVSSYPRHQFVGQLPLAHTPLPTTPIIVYLSNGSIKPVIMPNLTNHPLDHVIDFLAPYDIKPEIIGTSQTTNPVVIDQRPLAGTIIHLDQNPIIQLSIE